MRWNGQCPTCFRQFFFFGQQHPPPYLPSTSTSFPPTLTKVTQVRKFFACIFWARIWTASSILRLNKYTVHNTGAYWMNLATRFLRMSLYLTPAHKEVSHPVLDCQTGEIGSKPDPQLKYFFSLMVSVPRGFKKGKILFVQRFGMSQELDWKQVPFRKKEMPMQDTGQK